MLSSLFVGVLEYAIDCTELFKLLQVFESGPCDIMA